jgi:Hsp70 protein
MVSNSNLYHDSPQRTPNSDQSNRMMNNGLDNGVGIETKSGYLYLAAVDRNILKSTLLSNEHGQTATPITVAFVDDEVLIGESARTQIYTNSTNTFRALINS